ncbi:hypothetical protein EV198_3649 [Roseivirga ehrenbergii]|uniref:Uncharacterized protein n=1 Tax=Roseivirga ehrenbergii (strain DSM 102268 / JCM 13514 / KCTC 12282 / NCIMB 14502 / KMM 6017) TaxID=279360 RepID=A0A150XK49_ROSEK|nr:hypothetical protein [Roseivirga ehrenbergii]KYG79086.1 hypothetical protein MB14_17405 [Roseivirga ehrenbergii]TCK99117.1 hypothetical protein EV198_3649 [Roseivirga ehrenbergii]
MKRQTIVKLASAVAISGVLLVIGTLLSRLIFQIETSGKNTLLIIGFTMMLLGTLWKVVMEMNSRED